MAERSSPNKWQERVDTLTHAGVVFIVYSVYIYVALGLLAALLGSFLIPLGSGPGGLWGIPVFLYLVTFLIGLPSFIFGVRDIFWRRWHGVGRILACIAPLAIGLYFFMIPHALDPCLVGVWAPAVLLVRFRCVKALAMSGISIHGFISFFMRHRRSSRSPSIGSP